jgi:hypothetical protein
MIADFTAVEVDELGELDIFAQFDVVGNTEVCIGHGSLKKRFTAEGAESAEGKMEW